LICLDGTKPAQTETYVLYVRHDALFDLGYLLNALGSRFRVDQNIENCKDVAAVIEHARENVAE
jgi:hypothetical protein